MNTVSGVKERRVGCDEKRGRRKRKRRSQKRRKKEKKEKEKKKRMLLQAAKLVGAGRQE